jgi:hypothetical protein
MEPTTALELGFLDHLAQTIPVVLKNYTKIN